MSEQALLSSPLLGSGADSAPPSSFGSAERCEEHKEYVSLFCLDDLEPICKQCAADSHSRHRVYLSAEAAVDCKAELQTSLAGLDVKIKHLEDVIQTYQKAFNCNQAESKLTEEIMREEIERLHQFLRQEEAARLHALMEEKEEKMRKAEERMHRLNEVITSLEDKIQLTERELHAGGEGVGYLQDYKDTMSSTWCGNTKPERIQRPLINVAKHLGNLQYAVWEKMKQIAPCAPVTLGPRTAGQPVRLKSFHITPGCSQTPEQHMNEAFPANPERFQPHPCILATDGFNTGVHHWDIEVGNTKRWTVGVAAPSALRKTKRQASPEAGTWCISLKDGEYRALTSPPLTLDLDSSLHLSRVRVSLDCDGGTLEFTDADTDAPLFTFTHCFTETVYPYVESASVGDGVTALEQRGSVSVDSDYVPLKDAVTILEGQATRGNAPTGENTAAGIKREEDAERLSENKTSKDMCSRKEEKPAKSNGKEKTSNTREAKTQSRKSRFNASYHVSLNKALTDTATDCKTSNKSK
ncbi:zinc-binding protein A33-like [Fundulus diaphanus]